VAWAIAHTKDNYLSAFYHRMARRHGKMSRTNYSSNVVGGQKKPASVINFPADGSPVPSPCFFG